MTGHYRYLYIALISVINIWQKNYLKPVLGPKGGRGAREKLYNHFVEFQIALHHAVVRQSSEPWRLW